MKKILFSLLISACISIAGCCSIPRTADYKQLFSFTKEEKKIKGGLGAKRLVSIKDFRENDRLDEDIAALKKRIEGYIASNAGLNESAKNNLRELKAAEGLTVDEVRLLLGEPDRVIKTDKTRPEIWIYKINKRSTFTIIFLPVFFGHEEYRLYFKDNILILIERHYLKQTFSASDSGMGLERKKD